MFRAVLQEPAGQAVFDKFKISATPTMMLLDGAGAEVDWSVGYRPPAENVRKSLDAMLSGDGTFRSLAAGYAKNPKDVGTVFLLARKYATRFDTDRAAEKYREVIALDPDGKAGTYTNDSYKATAPYTEFAELAIARTALESQKKPDPAPIRTFLAKHPQSALVRQAYVFMESYYGNRAPQEEAAKFFEEYAGKFPSDPEVLSLWLTRIIKNKGPLDKGAELAARMEALTESNPSPEINRLLAQFYVLKGEKAKVEELYGPAFMEARLNDLAYSLVGYAAYWQDQNANLASAMAMADAALKLQPENASILRRAAGIYVKAGKDDQALAVYGPAFAQKSHDDWMALWQYAGFWAGQDKNLDDALAAAKRSVELLPGVNYPWTTLSLVYEKMKNYPEAIKAAEKALETAPEWAKGGAKATIERLKTAQAKK